MYLHTLTTDQPLVGPGARWACLQPALWLWQPIVTSCTRPADAATRAGLAAERWAPLGESASQQQTIAILTTQLCDLAWLSGPTAQGGAPALEVWAAVYDLDDLEASRLAPVALTFGGAEAAPAPADQQQHLPLLDPIERVLELAQPLPPPTLGESALLAANGGWHIMSLSSLSGEAALLQRELAETLTLLAGPAGWPPYTELLRVCAADEEYRRRHEQVEAKALVAHTHTRVQAHKALASELAELDAAYQTNLTLRALGEQAQANRTQWLNDLHHARRLAQQLAHLYWQQRQQQATPPSVTRQLPRLPQLFSAEHPYVPIPAAEPIHAVLAAYSNAQGGGSRWGRRGEDIPQYIYTHPTGTTIVQMSRSGATSASGDNLALDGRVLETLWRQVLALSDVDGDVLLVALAQARAVPPDEHGNSWITSPQVLEARGNQPIMKRDGPDGARRRAGHRREDLEQVAACFERMQATFVHVQSYVEEVVTSGRRKRKRIRRLDHQSRLINVRDVIRRGETETLPPGEDDSSASDGRLGGREGLAIAWGYQMGTWLTPFLNAPNPKFAWLVQKHLEYDPYRRRWEKRLARYFMVHLHLTAGREGAGMRVTVGTLLRASELEVYVDPEHPDDTRKRFELALNRLQADQQIAQWSYVADNPPLPSRGWLDIWLRAWRIDVWAAPLAVLSSGDDDITHDKVVGAPEPQTRALVLQSLREHEDMHAGPLDVEAADMPTATQLAKEAGDAPLTGRRRPVNPARHVRRALSDDSNMTGDKDA